MGKPAIMACPECGSEQAGCGCCLDCHLQAVTIRRLKRELARWKKLLPYTAHIGECGTRLYGECTCGLVELPPYPAPKPAKNPANRTNSGRTRGVNPAKKTRKR
jgi:hypothetical protein